MLYTYMYIFSYICIQIYIRTCICIYIYIHLRIYIYVYYQSMCVFHIRCTYISVSSSSSASKPAATTRATTPSFATRMQLACSNTTTTLPQHNCNAAATLFLKHSRHLESPYIPIEPYILFKIAYTLFKIALRFAPKEHYSLLERALYFNKRALHKRTNTCNAHNPPKEPYILPQTALISITEPFTHVHTCSAHDQPKSAVRI